MSPQLKTWLGNLGLAGLSVVATLAVLEHVVFRFILPPDDLLENVTINGVVRYAPGTQATFRHPDGRTSVVRINADGWNSTKPEYKTARTAGVKRIAVIGDSYVHGAFVNVDEAFPEIMERELKTRGVNVEVLRFGMDGAPLSQYLHVLRREVLPLKPDVVLVPLIHNDFDESYRLLKTRYASSFMKLAREPDGSVSEVQPADFRYGLADTLRGWRTFRYLYYETNLYLHAKGWISRAFWGGNEEWSPEFISSAVDIRKIADHQANRFFARHVLAEMKKLSQSHGIRLAFVMDGVREAVYAGRPAADYEVGMLNRIAADLTRELDLPFLDLQEAFERDWKANGQRLEYAYDWHWNARANRIVAEAAIGLLSEDSRIGLVVPRQAADRRAAIRKVE
jgi:hypothetical protein